jgi:putative endonuclease
MGTIVFGAKGESYAVNLLEKNGYKIIERNFRRPWGEIDIVAVKDDTLVFVEVKTRMSDKFGLPEEAVTPRKIARIAKVGLLYSKLHPELPQKTRIDVVSILITGGQIVREKIIEVY